MDSLLAGVDSSLTGVDSSLAGMDSSLAGVDSSLTGITGVDRSHIMIKKPYQILYVSKYIYYTYTEFEIEICGFNQCLTDT